MNFAIIDIFTRAIIVGVAASITVGPVAILCIQRTLSKNRRSGIVSGLGVASADTFLAFISYIFYSILQSQILQYDSFLRVGGGLFVVVVGGYIFMQNPVMQIRRNRSGRNSLWKDFASIFGLTITNFIMVIPYILAFFAVFGIPSFDSSSSSGMVTAVVVLSGFFLGSSLWWSALACLINLFRRKFRPRHLVIINRVAGSIIAMLGLSTILSTFIDLIDLIPNELLGH
ncbi:MAG: LysE family transporter [Rikenellaceae bacterium]